MSRNTISEMYTDSNFADDPIAIELRSAADLFGDLGYDVPYGARPVDFLYAAGRPFIPYEMPYAQSLTSLSPEEQFYFGTKVHPEIAGQVERRDPNALNLAHQIGRVLGANGGDGPLIRSTFPVIIGETSLTVDQKEVQHTIGADSQPGLVLDLGMGLNGVFAHIKNVQQGRYNVFAVQAEVGEVRVLDGLLDYYGVSEDRINVVEGGIAKTFDYILSNGGAEMADLIIASRVHMAGEDLTYGVEKSSELLRATGFLICRGPRRSPGGVCVGYDEIAKIIEDDGALDIIDNYTFAGFSSENSIEPSRLVIAQKKLSAV